VMSLSRLSGSFLRRHRIGLSVGIARHALFIHTRLMWLIVGQLNTIAKSISDVLVGEYGLPSDGLFVVPHGADTASSSYDRDEAKRSLRVQGRRVILFFGEIRRQKGIETVIRASTKVIRDHPDAVFLIVGHYRPQDSLESAGYLDELLALVKSLGVEGNVAVDGHFVPARSISTYYAAADMVVLPYVEDALVSGSGPLSKALGYGKAIIATRIPMFQAELSAGKNALLFEPWNSEELADAIELILGDERLRDRLEKKALEIGQARSFSNTAENTLSLYRRMVRGRVKRNRYVDRLRASVVRAEHADLERKRGGFRRSVTGSC